MELNLPNIVHLVVRRDIMMKTIHLFPVSEGDMKICSPKNIHISRGLCLREM